MNMSEFKNKVSDLNADVGVFLNMAIRDADEQVLVPLFVKLERTWQAVAETLADNKNLEALVAQEPKLNDAVYRLSNALFRISLMRRSGTLFQNVPAPFKVELNNAHKALNEFKLAISDKRRDATNNVAAPITQSVGGHADRLWEQHLSKFAPSLLGECPPAIMAQFKIFFYGGLRAACETSIGATVLLKECEQFEHRVANAALEIMEGGR